MMVSLSTWIKVYLTQGSLYQKAAVSSLVTRLLEAQNIRLTNYFCTKFEDGFV